MASKCGPDQIFYFEKTGCLLWEKLGVAHIEGGHMSISDDLRQVLAVYRLGWAPKHP